MKRFAVFLMGALLLGGLVVSGQLADAQNTDPHPDCLADEKGDTGINPGEQSSLTEVTIIWSGEGDDEAVQVKITDAAAADGWKIMLLSIKAGSDQTDAGHSSTVYRPDGVLDTGTKEHPTDKEISHIDICIGEPVTTTTTLAPTTTTVPATTTTAAVAGTAVTPAPAAGSAAQVLGEVVTAPAAQPVQAQPRFTG